MQIQSTINYDRFILLQGNIDVIETKVKHLVDAIKKKNLLHLNPIQVNEKLEVIDGQHRLEAAKRLNVPVYYIIERGLSIDDAILENSNISGWQGKDYLKSWVDRGNEHYRVLALFCEQYELPIMIGLSLLTGKSSKPSGERDRHEPNSMLRVFKEGRLKLRSADIKKAEAFAEKLAMIKPYADGTIWKSAAFVRALQTAYDKDVSPTKFLKKMETHGFRLERRATVKDYLRQIEDIMNHAARQGHTVRLYQ